MSLRLQNKFHTLFVLVYFFTVHNISAQESPQNRILRAAFLAIDGVYNSELMAPYDIFHHSIFRDSTNYIRPFIVSPDGKPFVTFEGLMITPHFSFNDAPKVDILVIPSTATSMTLDLENDSYMTWLRQKVDEASFVISVCDGAFPLAATGVLDNKVATTFPGDRARFAEMFPAIEVRHDVNFVADGKFITSVGGALSYEPALFLLERLYSPENAQRTAEGLVLQWDLQQIPHLRVQR